MTQILPWGSPEDVFQVYHESVGTFLRMAWGWDITPFCNIICALSEACERERERERGERALTRKSLLFRFQPQFVELLVLEDGLPLPGWHLQDGFLKRGIVLPHVVLLENSCREKKEFIQLNFYVDYYTLEAASTRIGSMTLVCMWNKQHVWKFKKLT